MIEVGTARGMTRTYAQIVRGHRRLTLAGILAGTGAGLTEGLGMASLIPLLQRGTTAGARSEAVPYIGLFLGLLVVSVLLRVTGEVLILRLNGVIERDLRTRLLDAVLHVAWPQMARARQGDLAAAVVSEAGQVANGVSSFATGVAALGIAVVLGITAGVLGPYLTLAAAAFALISIVVFRRAGKISAELQRHLAQNLAELNEETSGLIPNLKFLRSIGARGEWASRTRALLEDTRRTRLRDASLPNLARAVVEFMGACFLAGVLAVSIFVWDDIARGLVFITIFYRIIPRLQLAQGQLMIAKAQIVWWDRFLGRVTDLEDNRDEREGRERRDQHNVVIVQSVSKTYPGRDRPALERVSLQIESGVVTAVIGPTGSGKSTLIDLISGLVAPDDGAVLVDSLPLDSLDMDHWQSQLGLVPQDPPMVYGSVAENIAWLRGERASSRTLEEVAEAAQLTALLEELPDGIDTVIGSRGASLSGGQRQRIAIARALYREPRLLILDEATSALDPVTERRVLDAVLRLDPRTAVLFITHRTETALRADRVVVLDRGRVIGYGTADQIRQSSDPTIIGLLRSGVNANPTALGKATTVQ